MHTEQKSHKGREDKTDNIIKHHRKQPPVDGLNIKLLVFYQFTVCCCKYYKSRSCELFVKSTTISELDIQQQIKIK